MKKRTVITEEVGDIEVELSFEPVPETIVKHQGDEIVVGYLVQEAYNRDVEDLMGDGMGKLYSFHRNAGKEDHTQGFKALGRDRYGDIDPDITPDKDAQLLACYEHSGQFWSLSNEGYQCQWDTCNSAGVWVPDYCLREQLDEDERAGKDRAKQARIYAREFLDQYNDIIAGNVFGVVVERYDQDGSKIVTDDCWGYVGYGHATESLREQFNYYTKEVAV